MHSDTETDIDAEMARKAEKALWRQKVRERREGKEDGYAGMPLAGMGEKGKVKADGLGDLKCEDSDARPVSQSGDDILLCSHPSHQTESEEDRGRSGTERDEQPGMQIDFEGPEEISPGSVREVHEAVVDLGIVNEASEAAEHSAEEKDHLQACPVGGNDDDNHGANDQEAGEDRYEKSVAGQVR